MTDDAMTFADIRAAKVYLNSTGEKATCANCGAEINNISGDDSPSWRHTDPERMRGCRAASFKDGEWDETIPKQWKARPLRPGRSVKTR